MNTTLTSSTIRNRPGSGRTRNSMTAQSRVRKVPKTLSRAVVRSSGRNANSTALTAGMIRIALTTSAPGSVIVAARRRSWPLAAEAIERVHVDRIEALANAEQEDPDHDQRDENRKGDADLDHQRHAFGACRGEDQPVLDRHEADHLPYRITARHHHQQAEEDHGQGEGEILAHQRTLRGGDRQHHHDRQSHQADAAQHRLSDADHGLDVAMNAQPNDDPVQHHGDHDRLDDQRDHGGDVQMGRVLDVRLPRHRHRDHEGVQGEDVEKAEHAILIEQHETHQHQAAGEQMRDIEGEPVHQPPRETKRSRAARRPSMSAAPRNSETRKTRILAMTVSNTASTNPPTASLSTYTGTLMA